MPFEEYQPPEGWLKHQKKKRILEGAANAFFFFFLIAIIIFMQLSVCDRL